MGRQLAPIFLLLLILPGSSFGSERIIAVQGEATMEVEPDQIAMEIVVTNTHESDVAKAKAVVDEVSLKVADTLISKGVDANDITSSTMTIDVEERYDRNDISMEIGHLASREIDVKIRDVTSYTTIIQALVEVGVTRITGVRAEVSNYDELRLQTLGAAAKDARRKAEYLAAQLDTKLGSVHRIGDHRVHDQFGQFEEVIVTASKVEDFAPYEFQPGTVEVSANIHVEFELE